MHVPQHVRITVDLVPGTTDQYRVGVDTAIKRDSYPIEVDRRAWVTRPRESQHGTAVVINTLINLFHSQLPALLDEFVTSDFVVDGERVV